jgi:radical SAM superfamily enzyme YgiQ (UPF0313 family)
VDQCGIPVSSSIVVVQILDRGAGAVQRKTIAIIDILTLPEWRPTYVLYHLLLTKQYAGIMPQAVSTWCRQIGHHVCYSIYYGIGDPWRLVPSDADMVFLACYTQASPLAYALAKRLRSRGIVTVLGGPHAKAFPTDALRFFDYVVGDCNRDTIADLVAGNYRPGSYVKGAPPKELPLVAERLPEIERASLFFRRLGSPTTTIQLISSLGCPYRCSFCIDWNSQYQLMPMERLVEDLRFIRRRFSHALVGFADPNFGVKFDQTLDALETQDRPLPYIMESSLSVLAKPGRLHRLSRTNCVFVAPGIESWDDFSNKSASAGKGGASKLANVIEQFSILRDFVPNAQANFIFGFDTDEGNGPIDYTRAFIDAAPHVWPTINIPVPFGGTPLFDAMLRDGRILPMPFLFYYAPYCVMRIKNYDPRDYYALLIGLLEYLTSPRVVQRRTSSRDNWIERAIDRARAWSVRSQLREYRRIAAALRDDRAVLAFHRGDHARLPDFYRAEYDRCLGTHAWVPTAADRTPVLDQLEASA